MECCEIYTQDMCTRKGDTVPAWELRFDIDISNKLFFYESHSDYMNQVVKKSLGNGMYILGTNSLIFDEFVETRDVGTHSAFMKVADEEGLNTIWKWNITVMDKKVEEYENS